MSRLDIDYFDPDLIKSIDSHAALSKLSLRMIAILADGDDDTTEFEPTNQLN